MPFLITVAAFASVLGAVAREMTHLIALAAFDTLSRARLRALISLVARLFAVAACKRIVASLVAITGTVSFFIAVDTLDNDTLDLCLILGTATRSMAELCQGLSVRYVLQREALLEELTVTVVALGDSTIHRNPRFLEAFEILLYRGRPLLFLILAHTLGTEKVPKGVLLINLALEIDQSIRVRHLLVLK